MAIKFIKPDNPLGVFDGFDELKPFQMIPEGKSRRMSAITEQSEVRLRATTPNTNAIQLREFSSNRPMTPALDPRSATLPPNATVTFSIVGESLGNDRLILESMDGKQEFQALICSVKDVVKKTYNVGLLTDIRGRKGAWLPEDVPRMLRGMEKIFSDQANLVLRQSSPKLFDVDVYHDIGNLIDFDDLKIVSKIFTAIPKEGDTADIFMTLTWTAKKVGGVHFGGTKYCFVVGNGFGSADPWNGRAMAHEMGHALGLDHTLRDRLMTNGIIHSSLLTQVDINTLNGTDSHFRKKRGEFPRR